MKVRNHLLLILINTFFHNIHGNLILSILSDFTNYTSTVVQQTLTTIAESSELDLNTTQVITKYGYKVQEYQVITEDGYILALVRIINTGPVIFLMHGILSCADDWTSFGVDALPYLLADAGYDVWLGNTRGNKYCRNHISLSPEQEEFWDFSWHEIGIYDLPTMIDFALKVSNTSQLTYIGYSQGTTVFYVMTSMKPEYNEKINGMISLATVAWLHNTKSPLFQLLVPLSEEEGYITNTLGIYDILAYDTFWKTITTTLCPSSTLSLKICMSVLFSVVGFDYAQLNYTRLPIELGRLPAGTSIKQLLHYSQVIQSKDFRQYDFENTDSNIKAYGSETPPSYAVENITVPIAIIYGDNDLVSQLDDVKILVEKLPNVIDLSRVPDENWNHFDYLWAKDVKSLVYDRVLEIINNGTLTNEIN